MLTPIKFHYPIFDRRLDFDTEELTQLELVGRVAETLNSIIDIVNDWQGQLDNHELSADISNKRKLSSNGNFTGTLMGKMASSVLSEIGDNMSKIKYISNQFSDGQTGFVIDGGFFEDDGIHKNYNGGMF